MNNKDPKNTTSLDLSRTRPNNGVSDFKAEVIAAYLIEQGYNSEQISILREGTARRGFSTDVSDVELNYSMHNQQEYLHIKANKEGLYDMLPQGIFHQQVYKKNFIKDKEEVLEEVRIRREEEFYARRFFQPFEIISDETLTEANLYETRYNKKISRPEFVNLFVQYWPILELLDRRQANYFMYIVPLLHSIRSQQDRTEESLSLILDAPVSISKIKLPAKKADRYFESHLGNSSIGVDMVLGSSFDDGEYDLKVTVGPISALRMLDFLETAKGYRLLELLCDLFLPVGAFVVKEFEILPEDSAFILSDENHTTFLGINSFI